MAITARKVRSQSYLSGRHQSIISYTFILMLKILGPTQLSEASCPIMAHYQLLFHTVIMIPGRVSKISMDVVFYYMRGETINLTLIKVDKWWFKKVYILHKE